MSVKKILIALVVLIPLLLIGAVMFLLANPEYYREQILATAEEQSGFEIAIDGELKWRYWPPIALRITDVSVTPAGGNEPLATLKEAAIDLQLLPLLFGSKELAVNGLSIDGLTVNAKVDKNGKANWETGEAGAAEPSTPSESSPSEFGVDIRSMQIMNTHIDYTDDSAGASYVIDIPRIETGPFQFDQPTQLNIEMTVNDPVSKMTVELAANGKLTFDAAFEQIKFDALRLDETVTMQDFPALELAVKLDGTYNTVTSKLDTAIAGRFDNTKLNGTLAVDMSSKLSAVFDLTLDAINLNTYLGEPAPEAAAGPSAPPEDVEVLPLELLNEYDVDGKLAIGALSYDTYKFTDLAMNLKNKDKKLGVNLNMKGYDGSMGLEFNASTQGSGTGTTHMTVAGMNIVSLMEVEALTGLLNIDSNTRFSGHMLSDVMNTLNGKSTFNLRDGTIDVTAIKRVAMVVDGLRGKNSGIETWPDMMPFDSMAGNHAFAKGTQQGQTFDFVVENITASGTGGFDYFKNTLAYDVTVRLDETSTGQFRIAPGLAGTEWPIHCKGSFDDAATDLCRADSDTIKKMLTNAVKDELKQKGEQAVKEKLEKEVGEETKEKAKSLLKGIFNRDG